MYILIVLVIILIVFSGWNLKSLYDLKKFNKSKQELKDDKYYELKYKIEFITTIAIVVISVGGFFGYKASDELNNKANNLKTRLDSLDRLIIAKKDTLYNYDTKTKSLNDSLIRISARIKVINNKSIIKQDFYIVDNLKFPATDNDSWEARFYYRDLKTIGGDSLPSFKKAPFLVAVPENEFDLGIKHIGREYFDIVTMNRFGDDDTVKFSIMISQK